MKKKNLLLSDKQQIDKIIKECNDLENAIILYTIVETKLAKYLANQSQKFSVPCFGVLKLNFKFFETFESKSYSQTKRTTCFR